jgi:hypothetical protein
MAWKILQWPIAFFLASTGFGLVYYYAPDAQQEWVWITPGALAALWILFSIAFRFYVVNIRHYEEAYGTLPSSTPRSSMPHLGARSLVRRCREKNAAFGDFGSAGGAEPR